MEQLPRLQARISNLNELRDLIGALRALAASHVKEADAALTGIRRYVEVVEDAIGKKRLLTSNEPPRKTRREERAGRTYLRPRRPKRIPRLPLS